MKNPNKRELEKIAFNHSSTIDFKDFMNLNLPFILLSMNSIFL